MTITDIRPTTTPDPHASTVYTRACDRCGTIRPVRNPSARRNLCRDCVSVLTPQEIARWAA